MHKQRIVLVLAAAAGILSAVMPWQNIAIISQSGLDLGQAWIVFAIFGAALGVSLLGSWAQPLSGIWRALGGLGGTEKSPPMMNEALKAMIEPAMGLYAMIAAGAVVAIASLYRARRSTLLPKGPFAD
jgi:hypothetical protein